MKQRKKTKQIQTELFCEPRSNSNLIPLEVALDQKEELKKAIAELLLNVVREEATRALELELEQARYEARLAGRRYEAVDLDNRLVSSELEARRNTALCRVRDLESKLDLAPILFT